MKNKMTITVGESMHLRVKGFNRTTGDPRPVGRFIWELLEMAQNRDGVYGSKNAPVSKGMTVGELLDWHTDYNWTISC